MLFTFSGKTGHFLPVALTRAVRDAGHLVAFGAEPGIMATI